MKAPRPLRFALVGCGTIADTHAKAIAALSGTAQLAACCDLEPERARTFGQTHGCQTRTWTEILGDEAIDAVTICTPSGLHGCLAIEALRAGKHVLIEKPMELNAERCAAVRAQAETSGRQVGVISQHRFDPASQAAHHALQRGALGPLLLVDARIPWYRTQEYYDSATWRGTLALDGGGCLINQGIHTLDLMLWLAGPVCRVQAVMRTAAHERIEVEDSVCATLEFSSGAIGSVVASTAAYPGFPASLAIHGKKGSVVIAGDELNCLAIQGQETIHGAGLSAHAIQIAMGGTRSAVKHSDDQCLGVGQWAWGDAHRAQITEFCTAIHEKRPCLSDGRDGQAALALIDGIYKSARENRAVSLTSVD